MEKITIEDEYYPERLKNIENPPKILYLEGNKELLKTNIISIVGTRTCSQKRKGINTKIHQEISKTKYNNSKWISKRNRHNSTYFNFTKQRKNNSSIRRWIKQNISKRKY